MNLSDFNISLAQHSDAKEIALLSRDLIEHDLSWRYRPQSILRLINANSTNVAAAKKCDAVAGFGIMTYKESRANLSLLAVKPAFQSKGVGTALVDWLELVARTAGLQWLDVQVRKTNSAAIAFYRAIGFNSRFVAYGTYDGKEDCLRMVKNLYKTKPGGISG